MLVHIAIFSTLHEDLGSHVGRARQVTFGFSVVAELQISEKSERKISSQFF